jgi:RHS repeat-associated protein
MQVWIDRNDQQITLESECTGTPPGNPIYVQGTEYDSVGRVMLRMLGSTNPVQTHYTYYPRNASVNGGKLQQIYTTRNAQVLQNFQYSYDSSSNITSILDYVMGSPQTQSFEYDSLDRLTSAGAANGTDGNYSESYSYDAATGNLSVKGSSSYNYGAQSAGCPDGALDKAHAAVAAGGNYYCYDPNGNMVRRTLGGVNYTLTYDAENHMTGYSGGSVSASFVYDGDGQRVQATLNGVTTQFVGSHVEWQSSTSDMVRYYYAGGVRVAMRTGADGLVWLVGDHLGSTSIAVNAGDGSSTMQGYKAWGETRFGSLPTKYQYTGKYKDSYINLYWYGSRWYDSDLGRWTQPDTLIPDIYNSLDYDRYQYVRSKPLMFIDPGGHIPILGTALLGFVIGGGVDIALQLITFTNNGMTIDEAMKCIDWAQVGGSAVGGLVFGATFGLGTAALGTGYLATAASGALAGVLGGQANILAESGIDEFFEDQGFDANQWIENAIGMGLFDGQTMKFDAASGAIVGVAGKAFSDLVTKAITSVWGPSNHDYGVPVIKLFKDQMYIEISGRPGLHIEQTTFEQIRLLVALGLWDKVKEILGEAVRQDVKNWQAN